MYQDSKWGRKVALRRYAERRYGKLELTINVGLLLIFAGSWTCIESSTEMNASGEGFHFAVEECGRIGEHTDYCKRNDKKYIRIIWINNLHVMDSSSK